MTDPNDQTGSIDQRSPGVTAYLVCKDASSAIEFYKSVFGATEQLRLQMSDGLIGHAELELAGGRFMLADEFADMNILSPKSLGGSGVGLMVYVDDADALFNKAIEAGGTVFKELADQFYGERSGTFDDPFGHRWTIATRREQISNEEIQQRFQDLYCDDD